MATGVVNKPCPQQRSLLKTVDPVHIKPEGSPNADTNLSNCKCCSSSYIVFCVLALALNDIQIAALKPNKRNMSLLLIGHKLLVKLTVEDDAKPNESRDLVTASTFPGLYGTSESHLAGKRQKQKSSAGFWDLETGTGGLGANGVSCLPAAPK